jgi:SUKH-3 immunity protein of toxin-antitoxin system
VRKLCDMVAWPMKDESALLKRAGWSAGKTTQIDGALAALNVAGYAVGACAAAILREFSGLTVESEDRSRVFWIDGERAAVWVDKGWCDAYREAIGSPLVPIGGYSHMSLVVDETGGIWGGYDAEFGRLADSVEGLVRVLLVEVSGHLDRRVNA